jgi:hypothetical protein
MSKKRWLVAGLVLANVMGAVALGLAIVSYSNWNTLVLADAAAAAAAASA